MDDNRIAPFDLDAGGYHAATGRRYHGRLAELVTADNDTGSRYRRVMLAVSAAGGYVSAVTRHLLTGRKTVNDEAYNRRRATCDACPSRDPVRDVCKQCKCPLTETILGDKLRWASSTCPLNKWGKHDSEPTAAG